MALPWFDKFAMQRTMQNHPPSSMVSSLALSLTALAALSMTACNASEELSPLPQDKVVTVAEARALSPGSSATVEGFVTVAPGTFNSANSDQGFAVEDETGGIYVSLPDALPFGLDAKVHVTGKLGQTAQQTMLMTAAASVKVVDGKNAVKAKDLTTGGVAEPVEGQLVHVSGTVTKALEEDPPYGVKAYINDGSGELQIFIHLVGGKPVIETASLVVGKAIQVTGLAAQYETTYEVAPRKAEDLVIP